MKSLQSNNPFLPGFSAPGARITSLPVAARLRVAYGEDQTGFAFEPEGEFPRRVRQGEPLARAGGFPLLAPRSGPVEHDEEERIFDLRVEGALRVGRGGERETLKKLSDVGGPDGLRAFLDQMREAGIPSLDFEGQPLFSLFETALASEGKLCLIISTKDPESAVHWERLIGGGFAEMAGLLEELLATRGTILVRRYGGRGTVGLEGLERYGRFLPSVIVRQILPAEFDLDPAGDLAEQGVIFLGPATLYALQNWLLHDRPFFSRPVALRIDSRAIFNLGVRQMSPLHELPNGYPLREVFQSLGDPERTGIIAGDYVRNREQVIPAADLESLNVFRHSAFYASRRHRRRYDLNLPCTGCMACQRLCPTDASPLSLVEGRSTGFVAENCVQCGICTFACESAIPIDRMIEERKAVGSPLVER